MATTIIGKVSPTMGGAYSAGQTYAALTFVENDGSLYISLQTAYGIEPGVSANWEQYWMLCASRGEKGDTGDGLKILGQYATLQALQQAVPNPSAGDAYSIGASVPYSIYIWDEKNSVWVDNGQIQGPQGEAGQIEIGTVETGAPGTAASVTNVGTAESAILNFVIPQGYTGAAGSTWYSGAGINGTASTPTVFPGSGVASANPNDFYLNSGTTNVYRCITGGAPSVATWVYVMALNAGAVLYNLAQTLSTAQQQQAVNNIGALSVNPQTLSTAQQQQAVNNIGALSVNPQTLTQEQQQQVTTNIGAIPAANKGTAGGVATLNNNLKVSAEQACSTITAKTSNYTLTLEDAGTLITMNAETDLTLTIPASSTVDFPFGTEIEIAQFGAGKVTISPESGVTLYSLDGALSLAGQYAVACIKKVSTDAWLIGGALA